MLSDTLVARKQEESLTSIHIEHRVYFAAVGFLALWVGVFGFFIPSQVEWALPWLVPPLHARFLGSMYLSGATFMVLALAARRWDQVRVVLPMIAIWTGMLFIISLFYLNEFSFVRPQPWIWFGAYFVYPLIALWLAWQHRDAEKIPIGRVLPTWARAYLTAQGIIMTVVALALLFVPGLMVMTWPWKITQLLAQLYAAPFLAYGVGSLLLARCQTWGQVRIAITATCVFAAGVLVASVIHKELFSATSLSAWMWFGGFSLATLALGLISIRAWALGRA